MWGMRLHDEQVYRIEMVSYHMTWPWKVLAALTYVVCCLILPALLGALLQLFVGIPVFFSGGLLGFTGYTVAEDFTGRFPRTVEKIEP